MPALIRQIGRTTIGKSDIVLAKTGDNLAGYRDGQYYNDNWQYKCRTTGRVSLNPEKQPYQYLGFAVGWPICGL
jgi:hypothetical protein